MTNGNPPRRPPPLDQVRPIEERYAPPPGQRGAVRHPGQPVHPSQNPHGHHSQHAGQRHPGAPGRPPQPPGHGRRPSPPRRRSGFGSVLLIGLIIIGFVVAAGAAFLLVNPPTDLIREQAVTLVKERTGRDLTIRGPASFTLYPSVGVSLKDVALSAPPDMGGTPTVVMESLDVSVKFLPLLSRRVEVNRLVLTRPTFDLRIDKAGRKSWDVAWSGSDQRLLRFAELAGGAGARTLNDGPLPRGAVRLAQAATPLGGGATARADKLAALKDVVLDDVRIVDGTLNYADARNGASQSTRAINVAVRARTLTSPLTANGDLEWQGQTIRFEGTLTTLYEILAEAPAKLALSVAANPLKANYSGGIDVRGGTSLDGSVSAQSKSLRALALWFGSALPENEGFGALSVSGRLKTRTGAFQLANADISLDHMRVTGSIDGTTGGARPYVKAELKVSELNLNTYMGSGTGAQSRPAAKPSVQPLQRQPASPQAPPQSIEDLLQRQSGPQVKGYTARSDWSDDPIDVSLLQLVDADAKLSVGKLLVRDITVGQSDLTLALKNGVAKTVFDRVDLYGGSGRGQITIDGSSANVGIAASIVMENISAEPLLTDAASIEWLSGNGRLTLATNSRGGSERQLVAALNGKGSFVFTDGAIKGFNFGKAIRGLQQGELTNLATTPAEKTDFSELSASFDIVNGVVTNQDLKMMSPLLRVAGNGQVMLPERRVDYMVNPKLVADLSGQGGNTGLAGLNVPIRIVGPWDKPDIAADLSKVDAGQAVKAVEEIGKRLKGKNAGEIVDDLFGKDSKEGKKAKKFLDQLFR
jgi:AsmA protein